jgi:hypothetical protein
VVKVEDSTLIKLFAIGSLTALEIANLLTLKLDGNVLLSIGAIIGGVAGYEIRGVKKDE